MNLLKKLTRTQLVLILLVVIFVVKLLTILSYNDVDWEPDSYMHFLELRTVYQNFPNNLPLGLGVWTKPLYAYTLGLITSVFNINKLIFIDLINVLIFLIISFLVYKLCLKFFNNFKIALLSIILTSFSLTLFKSSTSALTDGIFTLSLVLGFYFTVEKKYYLSSVFWSISILGRIEALYFIGVYALYLLIIKFKTKKEVIFHWIILVIPTIIWNLLGYLQTGLFPYMFKAGYPSVPGAFGFGNWLSYPRLFLIKELLISLLFVFASVVIILIVLKKIKLSIDHFKELFFLFLLTSGFILIQIVLWRFGLFGTAGLIRYFISVLPFMVIVVCLFLKFLLNRNVKSLNLIIILFALFQITFTYLYLWGMLKPREFPKIEQNLIAASQWVKENVDQKEFLGTDRPEVIYYSERDLKNSTIFYSAALRNDVPGIYIWTVDWGEKANGISKDFIDSKAILLKNFDNSVYIYRVVNNN